MSFSALMPSLSHAQSLLPLSRVQRCSAELAGLEDAQRKRLFSECLVIRLEAERLIERDCRKQFQAIEAPLPVPDKATFLQECVSPRLTGKYAELPRRAIQAPKLANTQGITAASAATDPARTSTPISQTRENSVKPD